MKQDQTLRNVYIVRTVVQLSWAAALIALAAKAPAIGAILLVVYPLSDVASTLYELNANRGSSEGTKRIQYANVAFGLVTAIVLLVFLHSEPYAVASFGVWALAAGLLQLVVGILRRRQTGGQWAMMLSGAQSTAAGVAFLFGGLGGKFHIKDLGGYAIFGAVYFLISAVLLTRRLSRNAVTDQSALVR